MAGSPAVTSPAATAWVRVFFCCLGQQLIHTTLRDFVRLFRKTNPNDLELRKRNNSGIQSPNFVFFSVRQIFAAARREADGERGDGSGSEANIIAFRPGNPERKNNNGATSP